MPYRCSPRMMRASAQWRVSRGFAIPDIDAIFRAAGLAGAALGRSTLAACVLCVAALDVSALGALSLGRFSPARSQPCSSQPWARRPPAVRYISELPQPAVLPRILDPSVAFAGAVTVAVSPPPSERLRSPACAAVDAKTNPAIRMNLRMLKSPLEVDGKTATGARIFM